MRTADDGRGASARPRGRVLVRHRCLRGQRARASTATGGDAAPGPYRCRGLRRRRLVRLHQHRAFRLLPRVRRDPPAVDRRAAGRRGRPTCRPRPARDPPAEPAAPRRGGARRRQAARRRPHRRRREGRRARRLGRAEASRTSAAASRSACSRRGPTRCRRAIVRMEADGEVDRAGRDDRARPGRAHGVSRRSRRRCSRLPAERVTVRGTDTRFTPYDRSTGASRSTTIAGLAVQRAAEDVPTWKLAAIGGSADELDAGERYPGAVHDPADFGLRRGGELIGRGEVAARGRAAPTPRGPSSGRSASAPPRSRSTSTPGASRVLQHGDRSPTSASDQPAARRAPGRGRHDAGPRQRAVRGDACSSDGLLLNDTLLEYRVPSMRGPARLDDVHHRRERRWARAVRRQGLRRGLAGAGRPARSRPRVADAGVPDDRTATHARARLASGYRS